MAMVDVIISRKVNIENKSARDVHIMLVSYKRNEARHAINDHLLFYSPLNINYVFFFVAWVVPRQDSA